ncbi:hypothetical protein [Neorhodopirellula lusitana]|uniref:hypothetical protein n=1 Tax=Neorhodopirellula lusitana TaxID=445327 RepID=UPI00384E7D5F
MHFPLLFRRVCVVAIAITIAPISWAQSPDPDTTSTAMETTDSATDPTADPTAEPTDASSDASSDEPTAELEIVEATIEFKEQSWFTDVVATAIVELPDSIEESDELPFNDDVSFIEINLQPSTVSKSTGQQAVIRFLPRRPGLAVFPSLDFASPTHVYRTPAIEFMVSVPQPTEDMQLELKPAKTTVYAGEPLRVDVTWSSNQPSNRFRALQCFPTFFNEEGIEVVIPRCTADRDQQMGLPFGGRRIVAERTPPKDDPSQFGTVTFPLFLRFNNAGPIEIPATRLECAWLKGRAAPFAPYAAYYNNGLFEPLSALTAYERVYVETEPMKIEVLPLPTKDRSELFSDLFSPCEIEIATSTDKINVGQVLEVDIRVHGDSPHGMLELKPLTLQRSLRGRFQVSEEFGRTWYPDGTGFRARVRPLTTNVKAFPSLQIPIFDSQRERYVTLQTVPVPLQVNPQDGKDFFDVRSIATDPTLTDNATGIWHNARPTSLSRWMNQAIAILAEYMFVWLALGAAAFAILVPWVREQRRRAINPDYRRQALAYRDLRRQPEGTPEKWQAFRRFLSSGFSMPVEAWTAGDAEQRLRKLGLAEHDIKLIKTLHAQSDESHFSAAKPTASVPELNALAHRLYVAFRQAAAVMLLALMATGGTAFAGDWEDAESLFQQALDSPAGQADTAALYLQAALKFENAAASPDRRGVAWYNAGNAWFQTGELGQAIACYRQAKIYLPFDDELTNNLSAARALTVDVVETQSGLQIRTWPVRWIAAVLVPIVFLSFIVLLVHIRFRTTTTAVASIACLTATIVIGLIGLYAHSHSGSEGVVIVNEIYGRKGPAYSYGNAFNEPLHDGLEFHRISTRKAWLEIELLDGRQCWIPQDQARLIQNERF